VTKTATIDTSKGTIVADLFDTETPNTVANFEKLANSQFYDGTRFHRVIADFMIQGGDPLSKEPGNPRVGTGGPGYKIKCETHLNTHRHVAGTLSMAHAGKDTGGSQFFICHSPQSHLDKVHTVFGQVRERHERGQRHPAERRDQQHPGVLSCISTSRWSLTTP
jgi:peptidyl-prolyl cis-trans isomerase B (cyclophilin B)